MELEEISEKIDESNMKERKARKIPFSVPFVLFSILTERFATNGSAGEF